MTPEEEAHLHLEECINGLNESWSILQELRSANANSAIFAGAYRYALIAYTRPYTRSDGEHKKGRSGYIRPKPNLSQEELTLHQRIIDLRHDFLAHADLDAMKASVYVGRFGGVAQSIIGYSAVPDFPQIDTVISLIENSLDLLYVERTQSLERLAPPVS